ncbi:hypothetical protein [Skermanella stibiiresistens]|nr:hypothetical protein [Skermanella stibiiresistens]
MSGRRADLEDTISYLSSRAGSDSAKMRNLIDRLIAVRDGLCDDPDTCRRCPADCHRADKYYRIGETVARCDADGPLPSAAE